jgi:hypothetical protein
MTLTAQLTAAAAVTQAIRDAQTSRNLPVFWSLIGMPIYSGEQFIYWASTSGEQRPAGESTPNIFWA